MGRKKGSKNKPKILQKAETAIPLDIKDVRRQLRLLRKIKKDTRKGSDERHDLCRKIRELRKQLTPIYKETSPEKQKIIDKILKRRPEYKILNIDLYKFNFEQLQAHYEKIQNKAGLI